MWLGCDQGRAEEEDKNEVDTDGADLAGVCSLGGEEDVVQYPHQPRQLRWEAVHCLLYALYEPAIQNHIRKLTTSQIHPQLTIEYDKSTSLPFSNFDELSNSPGPVLGKSSVVLWCAFLAKPPQALLCREADCSLGRVNI